VASSKHASPSKKKAKHKARKRRASAARSKGKKRRAAKHAKKARSTSLDAPFFDWAQPLLPG
jgi:hypothetical protein